MRSLKLKPSDRQSIDFAEEELTKTKNLLGANLKKSHTSHGITFIVNDDGSITISGTATWSATFKLDDIVLPKGTYIGSVRNKKDNTLSTNGNLQIHYDNVYANSFIGGVGNPHTLSETKTCEFELFVTNGNSVNETVYIQLESGDTISEYKPYNGEIVHNKKLLHFENIETIFDKSATNINLNWGYTSGIATGITINKDLTKYKKLLISVGFDTGNGLNAGGIYEMDLSAIPNEATMYNLSIMLGNTWSMINNSGCQMYGFVLQVDLEKTQLTYYAKQINVGTNSFSDANLRIVKIEGVY